MPRGRGLPCYESLRDFYRGIRNLLHGHNGEIMEYSFQWRRSVGDIVASATRGGQDFYETGSSLWREVSCPS